MPSKKCGICRETKPISEFNKRSKSPDGYQGVCRSCNKASSRRYYADNKEKHKRIVGERKRLAIERNRRFIFDHLLHNPCVNCGESDPLVLEFDHLEGKEKSLATAVHNG